MVEKVSKAAPDAALGIDRILVPFDFAEPSAHALEFAQKLASTLGASVEVLYVVPFLPSAALPLPELGAIPLAAHSVDELLTDAEARLTGALESDGPREMRKTVKVGDPRAQIVAHAAAEDVDLIVMGTHGRTGATRLLLGSVAERVVREATCPVLTVH